MFRSLRYEGTWFEEWYRKEWLESPDPKTHHTIWGAQPPERGSVWIHLEWNFGMRWDGVNIGDYEEPPLKRLLATGFLLPLHLLPMKFRTEEGWRRRWGSVQPKGSTYHLILYRVENQFKRNNLNKFTGFQLLYDCIQGVLHHPCSPMYITWKHEYNSGPRQLGLFLFPSTSQQ